MITEIFIEGNRLDITTDISSLLTFAIDDIKDFGNRQFKQLMERVRKGDFEAGTKAKETFSFEPTQLKTLETELKQTA